ncbi:MAG: class I SAM-dependent methyltransferase [Gemmatimonadales bacterium]|nr:class I SAM-dependent methyltransferase [Gemmatimonadales bacterium]
MPMTPPPGPPGGTGDWFREWFDDEYLALYPHRDDAEAERLVALLRRAIPWPDGARVLDVGCGAGRHGRAFEAAGARYTGVDLSWPLLRRAREAVRGGLVRADMRHLPVASASMELTACLFTSFGYFADDATHAAVFAQMAATVRRDGHFVLDYLNEAQVRESMADTSMEWGRARAAQGMRRLSADRKYVEKTIALANGRVVEERVRLFTLLDLERMFRDARLAVTAVYGDYDGGPLDRDAPRALIIGRRTA